MRFLHHVSVLTDLAVDRRNMRQRAREEKNMKTRLLWLFACLMAVSIAACGSPETETLPERIALPTSDSSVVVEEPVVVEEVAEDQPVATQQQTLVVSFPGDNRQETMQQIIDSFIAKKAGEGVLVTVQTNQPTDGYYDQVLLDFSAGVGPDVLSLSAEGIPEFVSADYLQPLDDRLAAWDEWANFPTGMQEMPRYNGSTYGVMYDTDTRLIYYRTDVFEQAGLPVPWAPTSWADVTGAAMQIQNATQVPYPIMIQSGSVWGEATTISGVLMLLHGAGGTLLDTADGKWVVESPELRDSLGFYETVFSNNLSNADIFMEPEPWVPYLQEGFPNGDVGIFIGESFFWGLYAVDGPWAMTNRDDVVGWAPMPAQAPGAALGGRDFIGVGGGWGWSMAKTSQNPELAWEFIQFMTSANSISRYTNAMGSIPARSDAPSDEAFYVALGEAVLPYQSFRPADPDYALVSEQIQLATDKIMLGQATAEVAMQEFAATVEGLLGPDKVKRVTE